MKKTTLLLLTIFLLGCTSNANTTTEPAILKGVGISPANYDGVGFQSFLNMSKLAGGIIGWYGDWLELSDNTKAPYVMEALENRYDYETLVIATIFEQSTGQLKRPLNETNKRIYVESASDFARTYEPKYMGFGIEINLLYESSPVNYLAFVELFNETYDAVKAVSPNTQIFTVFQLEKMKGLSGGLFGGNNDESQNTWFLLDNFSKADMHAFTTYPCLVYTSPEQIPNNYYSDILGYTSKPIAFTEAGWFTGSIATGWESSEAEQASFITKYLTMTKPLNPKILIWSFLYDQNTQEPFPTMGLFYNNGTPKLAWSIWTR